MNLCLLLHFYQPSNQLGEVVRSIAQDCYIPLIRTIKNDKRLKVTANFPLSLLEQLDHYGYTYLIQDIKELVTSGRLELVGSGAYHPLLTRLPKDFVEKQVILNESSLAYYFGLHKDFEGEDCFMIKGLKGFFPPEMAITSEVLEDLGGLGYEWVAVDDFCLPRSTCSDSNSTPGGFVYQLNKHLPKLVVRNRALTDLISFKRDLDRAAIVTEMLKNPVDKFVALDAETFGHHYKDGIYFLESLLADLYEQGVRFETLSEVVQDSEAGDIAEMHESTWSSVGEKLYPLWENPASEINTALWLLYSAVHTEFSSKYPSLLPELSTTSRSGGVPVWKHACTASTISLDSRTLTELYMLQLQQSDQFWWSSAVEVAGKKVFSRYMIESVLAYYTNAVTALGSSQELISKIDEIQKMLNEQHI